MRHPSKYHGAIEHIQYLPNSAEYIRCYGLLRINPQNAREATLTTDDDRTLQIQHSTRIDPAYNTKYMHVIGMRTKKDPTIIHSELLYVAIPHTTNDDVVVYAHRHNNRKWKYSKRYDVLARAITRNPRIIALSLTSPKDPTTRPWGYRFQTTDQRHHKWFYTRRRKCTERTNVQRMQPLYII